MEVAGRDELARLARSFNTTLDALERSVEAQRHLVADASHELRTPIASLRANIQTLEEADRLPPHELASLRADIVEELDELTALVADIVELARGTKPAVLADDVRLDEIVAGGRRPRARRARGAGCDFARRSASRRWCAASRRRIQPRGGEPASTTRSSGARRAARSSWS